MAQQDTHHLLICKGALEEVLAACTQARVDAGPGTQAQPLDAGLLARIKLVTDGLSAEGLRVVAVATKLMPASQTTYAVADEAGLTLEGYNRLPGPAKDSAAPALKALAGHGKSPSRC